MLQGYNFEIEGVARGQAKGNPFLYAEVPPGTYRLTAKGKGKGNQGDTEVSLTAGEVAVLRVLPGPWRVQNFWGSIVFDRVAPDSARADLSSIPMVCWEN